MQLHNTLLTGGSGLLGREMRKYINCDMPTHEELDITNPTSVNNSKRFIEPKIIIHCAAYTNVPRAEIEKEKCFEMNVVGTKNLIEAYPQAFFIYISSEQVTNPTNYYLQTKLQGEEVVRDQLESGKYLILRTLFKRNPFPYKYAFFDQYTTGDYIDIMAPLIISAIITHKVGTILVGTGRKTMFQLARRTMPKILANSVDDITDVRLPKDYL